MFGLLLGLGVKLGANIAYAISDAKCMSTPVGKQENGDYYYINRAGDFIAQNGERIITGVSDVNGYRSYRRVGERTGKVYCDPDARIQRENDIKNEKAKQKAIECGDLSYVYRNQYASSFCKELTVEISTGKYIGKLKYNSRTGVCKKYYLKPGFTYSSQIDENDEGIVITPLELKKLDVCGGGHRFENSSSFYSDLVNCKFTGTEEKRKEWRAYYDKINEYYRKHEDD